MYKTSYNYNLLNSMNKMINEQNDPNKRNSSVDVSSSSERSSTKSVINKYNRCTIRKKVLIH